MSVRGSEYLPRIRRIAACVAESVGLDNHAAEEAAAMLSCTCAEAIGNADGGPGVTVTLNRTQDSVTADVAGSAPDPRRGLAP